MAPDDFYASLWRDLRSGDSNLLLRLGLSIALAALIAGIGILAGYATDYLLDEPPIVVVFVLVLAVVAWLIGLRFIWGPARGARRIVRPIVGTLVVGALTCFGMVLADEVLHYEEEIAMSGVALCGGALVLFMWLGTLHRLLRGRPVVGRDNRVDVRCPSCGYCLVGLHDLRCPECGARFTIDELIRAQDYDRRGSRSDPRAPVGPPAIPKAEQPVDA